jgi:hypothetical protein
VSPEFSGSRLDNSKESADARCCLIFLVVPFLLVPAKSGLVTFQIQSRASEESKIFLPSHNCRHRHSLCLESLKQLDCISSFLTQNNKPHTKFLKHTNITGMHTYWVWCTAPHAHLIPESLCPFQSITSLPHLVTKSKSPPHLLTRLGPHAESQSDLTQDIMSPTSHN